MVACPQLSYVRPELHQARNLNYLHAINYSISVLIDQIKVFIGPCFKLKILSFTPWSSPYMQCIVDKYIYSLLFYGLSCWDLILSCQNIRSYLLLQKRKITLDFELKWSWSWGLRDPSSIPSAGSHFWFGCGVSFILARSFRNVTKNTGNPLCVCTPHTQSKDLPLPLCKE